MLARKFSQGPKSRPRPPLFYACSTGTEAKPGICPAAPLLAAEAQEATGQVPVSPVRRLSASWYFAAVFSMISAGNRGPGAVFPQSSVSR